MSVRDIPYGEEQREDKEKEMSFLDHLEELRWRIIYTLIGVVVGTIICWIFVEPLVDIVLLKPARDTGVKLINLRPFGQLFLYFQVAMVGGIILSLPNVFFQLWKFISPALRKKERKHVVAIVIYSTICFLIGIAFAYFAMLPLTLRFAAQFGSSAISNQFSIDEYMSIIISVMLAAGFVFELPMISFFPDKDRNTEASVYEKVQETCNSNYNDCCCISYTRNRPCKSGSSCCSFGSAV